MFSCFQSRVNCKLVILVQEGAHLYENSVDPYQGDVFHENPLVLIGANFVLNNFAGFVPVIFILLDLLTAVFIYHATKGITRKNVRNHERLLTLMVNDCFILVQQAAA